MKFIPSIPEGTKIKIIDTHSHLYSSKYNHDLEEVIGRSKEVLQAVFLPNIDIDSIGPMLSLTAKDPDFFFPMMGLHPTSVKPDFEKTLETIHGHLFDSDETYFGVGETGIDLYWDKSTLGIQVASLEVQIGWAKQTGLPIILHARNAIDETYEVIAKHHDAGLNGIFHCFDGTIDQAKKIIELGTFKLGIGGNSTYRKDVQAMLTEVDLDFVVLETDSPYLPPEPHRKDKPRRNESSYTKYVAAKIAELRNLPYDEVATITNRNARSVFPKAEPISL